MTDRPWRGTFINFRCGDGFPSLIYQACLNTGTLSNTAYIQDALCEALARDLGMSVEDLKAQMPPRRTRSLHLYNPDRDGYKRIGQDNSCGVARPGATNGSEEVK